MPPFPRVIVIVLDGAGCGELPDAAAYGDEGSDTLGNVARRVGLRVPNLRALGLGHAGPTRCQHSPPAPDGAWGRMAEASPGKDSVTGHWEIAGIVLDAPFPTFPDRVSRRTIIAEFERRIGRRTFGNVVASGTEIIDRLGPEHMRTGAPIVYTSADSVFQVAAHEEVIPRSRALSNVRERVRSRDHAARSRARDRAALRRTAGFVPAYRQQA